MNTNDRNKMEKLIYPELSYMLTGVCFDAHNSIGRFGREKQYCDFIDTKLKELKIPFIRECVDTLTNNRFDFLIDGKIVLETKAKRFLTREDYYQLQRYLQASQKKLGLLVNFQNRYIKPMRVVRIDTDAKDRFV